jgi:hypothetical protein
LSIKQLGIVRAKSDSPFEAWTAESRANFKQFLSSGLKLIRMANIPLTILPHLDAAGEIHEWRNLFILHPEKKYGIVSYADIMLFDVLDCLKETGFSEQQIQLNLAGEMGRTLFEFPDIYSKLIKTIKERYPWPNLKLGISLNHNSITGRYQPTSENIRGVKTLIEQLDFVGISCYHKMSVPPVPHDFELAITDFMREFEQSGIIIPKTMPIHFSEIGLGGKSPQNTDKMTPEQELKEIASNPWSGTSDPKQNPWVKPHLKQYRLEYHQALVQYLSNQTSDYQVTDVCLWSMGSWCPYGFIKHEFADGEITLLFDKFNNR